MNLWVWILIGALIISALCALGFNLLGDHYFHTCKSVKDALNNTIVTINSRQSAVLTVLFFIGSPVQLLCVGVENLLRKRKDGTPWQILSKKIERRPNEKQICL